MMVKSACPQKQFSRVAVLLVCILATANRVECARRHTGCSSDSSGEIEIHERIKEGTEAPRGRFPYMVSLRNDEGAHECGGILIHHSAVLTAAHCVFMERNRVVHIGAHGINDTEAEGAKVMRVFATVIHPLYDHAYLNGGHDLAILILPKPIHNVVIPMLPDPSAKFFPGQGVHTLGWGFSTSDHMAMPDALQQSRKSYVIRNDCKDAVDCSQACRWKEDLFLCLGGDATREGDSGGPALIPHKKNGLYQEGRPMWDLIIGITSGGDGEKTAEGVYTRLSSLRSWTLSVTDNIDGIKQRGLSAFPCLTEMCRSFRWFGIGVGLIAVLLSLAAYLYIDEKAREASAWGESRQEQAPAVRPMATPAMGMQRAARRVEVVGVNEAQPNSSSNAHSVESHINSPASHSTTLKRLPLPFSYEMVELGRELGRSHLSAVYHGTVSGADVSVQMVAGPIKPESLALQRACVNRSINHPNVVPILGACYVPQSFLDALSTAPSIGAPPGPQDTSRDGCVWILSEYCNAGDLEMAICAGKFCDDANFDKPRMLDILFAARDIAQGLEHLHDHGIVHAHLVPRNVLLKISHGQVQDRQTCNVTLSGLSRNVRSEWHQQHKRSFKTELHTAPELLEGDATPSKPSDVFALGVLLCELFTGKMHPPDEIKESILKGHRPRVPETCPIGYAQLIQECWQHQQARRPSSSEVVRQLNRMIAEAVRLPRPESVSLGVSSSVSGKIAAYKGGIYPFYDDERDGDTISTNAPCTSTGDTRSSGSHFGAHEPPVSLKGRPLAGQRPSPCTANGPTCPASGSRTDPALEGTSKTHPTTPEPGHPVAPRPAPWDGDRDQTRGQCDPHARSCEQARRRSLISGGAAWQVGREHGASVGRASDVLGLLEVASVLDGGGSGGGGGLSARHRPGGKTSSGGSGASAEMARLHSREKSSCGGSSIDGNGTSAPARSVKKTSGGSSGGTIARCGWREETSSGENGTTGHWCCFSFRRSSSGCDGRRARSGGATQRRRDRAQPEVVVCCLPLWRRFGGRTNRRHEVRELPARQR